MGMCDNQYAKILTSSEVLQEIVPLISKSIKDNPKIRNIAIIDDAAYSGLQNKQIIDAISP